MFGMFNNNFGFLILDCMIRNMSRICQLTASTLNFQCDDLHIYQSNFVQSLNVKL